MSNVSLSAIEQAEQVRFLKEELGPEMQKLVNSFHEVVVRGSLAHGWSAEQSDWISYLATAPFLKSVLEGVSAADAAVSSVSLARQALVETYYARALESGKGYNVAFLSLLEIERQLDERQGKEAVAIPDAWVEQAIAAVEAVAHNGGSYKEQINAGYAVLQEIGQTLTKNKQK